MQETLRIWVVYLWIPLWMIWLGCWLFAKKTQRSEGSWSRLIQLILIVAAFWLIFRPIAYVPALQQRFVPDSTEVAWIGFGMAVAGVVLAIWARLQLGTNWSGTVTIKQGHELVRSGPYAVVRHPIYSGFLLAMLGTAITIGEMRDLAGLVIAIFAWSQKCRLEDKFLEQEFGTVYTDYRRNVRALIPFVL